jgi:predicted homoserine dehydrogenase-like protein
MVHVTRQMAGMETFAIADIDISRPLQTLQTLGISTSSITVTDQVGAAEDALRRGDYVVTQDALLLPKLESLDALVEATGVDRGRCAGGLARHHAQEACRDAQRRDRRDGRP